MTSSAAALQGTASTPVLSAGISSSSTPRGSFSRRRTSLRPERGEEKPAYSSVPGYGWLEALRAMKIKSWRTKAVFPPRKFASRDPHGLQPIFAAFGASYDQAQILADLPNSKLWEFHTRKKWWLREKGLPDEARQQSVVLWGEYAVSGKPRKNIVLYRLRNPARWWKRINGRKVIDYVERIEIFDVIGFFQSSLLALIALAVGLGQIGPDCGD